MSAKEDDRDVLPWWLMGLILAVLAALVVLIRRHPAVPLGGLVVGMASMALMTRAPFTTDKLGGRLYGKGTTMPTLTAVAGLSVALAGFWKASGWWHLTLPLLAVWVTTVIGRADTPHRQRLNFEQGTAELADPEPTSAAMRKVLKGMPAFRDAIVGMNPAARVENPAEVDGVIVIKIHSDAPLKEAAILWATGRAYGLGGDKVTVYDLFADRVGLYEVRIGNRPEPTEFVAPLAPRPAVAEWPAGTVPVGEYGDGTVAYIPAQHGIIGGMTGSGKTVAAENLVWCKHMLRYSIIIIDPKRLMGGKYRGVVGVNVVTDKAAMLDALQRLDAEMDRRYVAMEDAGIEEWTGHRILCLVDETADLLGTVKGAGPVLVRLYQMARAAGIEMWCCTQRPDAQSVPPLVKANAGITIGLRVANPTAERVLLGEDSPWGIGAQGVASKLKPGRGVLVTPGSEDGWVQCYPSPGVVGLPRAEPAPTVPSTEGAEGAPSAPPYAGPMDLPHLPTEAPTEGRGGSLPEGSDDPLATLERHLRVVRTERSTRDQIVENLTPDDPITAVTLAEIVGTSDRNVRDILARLVADGVAIKTPKGWVRAA